MKYSSQLYFSDKFTFCCKVALKKSEFNISLVQYVKFINYKNDKSVQC